MLFSYNWRTAKKITDALCLFKKNPIKINTKPLNQRNEKFLGEEANFLPINITTSQVVETHL